MKSILSALVLVAILCSFPIVTSADSNFPPGSTCAEKLKIMKTRFEANTNTCLYNKNPGANLAKSPLGKFSVSVKALGAFAACKQILGEAAGARVLDSPAHKQSCYDALQDQQFKWCGTAYGLNSQNDEIKAMKASCK